MTRRAFSLALLFTLAAALFAADLPEAWRSWRYSRPITLRSAGEPVRLPLPPDVFAHSANRLADLRILDDQASEVPYLLGGETAGTTFRILPATLRENSFVPGQFTQLVVDTGETVKFHNTVRIETPETDFINWVEVAASDDARLWRIVKPRAPISRFRKENLEGNQTIRYSDNNARYLRLRIFEPQRQFPVSSVQLRIQETSEREFTPLPATLSPDPAAAPSLTRWDADLGSAALPVAEAFFETSQPEFYRAVRILSSEDGKEWRWHAGGEIHRYTLGEKTGQKTEESLRVEIPEYWRLAQTGGDRPQIQQGARYWRIEILNGSDAPLADVRVTLRMAARYALLWPRPGRSYRLLYGNTVAKAPSYDLAQLATLKRIAAAAESTAAHESVPLLRIAALEPEELTTNYLDPRPYSEKHSWLLWLAMAAAVLLLGYSALRALRAAPPGASA
ncbi:MAG: DUF3999 domain-containing protein [Acidobacteriia bacterium]|nr:DUF3999 domain-containing protein [Terriglobia bacterium]